MTYAVEMGSGAIMYIPIFMKTGSCIQKLIEGHTDRQISWRPHKATFVLRKIEQ
jgi:hypothetical protein